MRSILACVDFSDFEDRVLLAASSLARAFGAELHLLHVAEPEPSFVGYAPGPQSVRDTVAETLRAEHRRVEALAERVAHDGIKAHPHTRRGAYAETILREAEHLQADAIVLGSHGHGRLHTLLVGSVADGVLRGAKVPVLVVPRP
jgi:nucleotide-binding universal stress UspA family protein